MAIISHKVEGVSNDVTHYARVYPVNKKGHAQSELDGQIVSALTNAFPAEPTSYELIDTYTAATTFTAPEDGWYQIEVHGASGNGGRSYALQLGGRDDEGDYILGGALASAGGSGGGSGCGCSIAKLNKGDTIIINIGAVGSTTSAVVDSSIDDSYDHTISVTSGGNGGNGGSYSGGSAGSGGVSSGGNVSNLTGGNGSAGQYSKRPNDQTASVSQTAGGAPAHSDGHAGGYGAAASAKDYGYANSSAGGSGKAGFVKIYRGDTNVVAA